MSENNRASLDFIKKNLWFDLRYAKKISEKENLSIQSFLFFSPLLQPWQFAKEVRGFYFYIAEDWIHILRFMAHL